MELGTEVPRPMVGRLVRLRALEESDAEPMNPLFSDPEVLRTLSMTFPQPVDGFLDFWRGQRSDPSQINFTIEVLDTCEAIGICGLSGLALNNSPELGIWIGKPYWNRGYGTDAVRTLCRFGFREMGLRRIVLHVFADNSGGIRAYRKVGFKMEGTLRQDMFQDGQWVDGHVMGLLADEFIDDFEGDT